MGFLKVLVAIVVGAVILPWIVTDLIDLFVTAETTILGWLYLLTIAGGLFLGVTYLRKQSWTFILASFSIGVILIFASIMVKLFILS